VENGSGKEVSRLGEMYGGRNKCFVVIERMEMELCE
jgi:hypothetical protein